MKITAAVVREKGKPFQFEELDLQDPREGEVMVKIAASGVCHTDEVAQHQMIPVPLPAVLGHEGCGIVEKVGEGVTEFQKGDHVVFSFGYCGHCKSCLAGRPYACENFNAINFGGVMSDGTKRLSKDGREISSFFGQPIPLSIRTASLKWMRIWNWISWDHWDAESRQERALS